MCLTLLRDDVNQVLGTHEACGCATSQKLTGEPGIDGEFRQGPGVCVAQPPPPRHRCKRVVVACKVAHARQRNPRPTLPDSSIGTAGCTAPGVTKAEESAAIHRVLPTTSERGAGVSASAVCWVGVCWRVIWVALMLVPCRYLRRFKLGGKPTMMSDGSGFLADVDDDDTDSVGSEAVTVTGDADLLLPAADQLLLDAISAVKGGGAAAAAAEADANKEEEALSEYRA